MVLPTRKPEQPIEVPLIFDGLPWQELAAWHDYLRRHDQLEKCRQVELSVSKLPASGKFYIGKLKYYQPIGN